VTVTDAAGQPLMGAAAAPMASDTDPATWIVAPTGGTWPPGAQITVTVDGDARDALGMPIVGPATASFGVSP
jgi:hypothetical protein